MFTDAFVPTRTIAVTPARQSQLDRSISPDAAASRTNSSSTNDDGRRDVAGISRQ